MDQTFMTIHNLSHEATILFASASVVDILGYRPQDVHGKSCFDYFHPDEVPFARSVHNRGVLLDKAAVLHYARILSKDGRWVSCECCFTIVHDVLVACTSIYRRGRKSERRAIEAPQIRKIFSCSPRDPRYHMLEHLSPKFKMQPTEREPRAALILNRFTRTLTIMFATNAVSSILGLGPDELRGRSLYEFIAENCWSDAVKCLERAKANDSIAYLRFWSRGPYVNDPEGDVEMEDRPDETSENDTDHGGVSPEDTLNPSACDGHDNSMKKEATSDPRAHRSMAMDEMSAQQGLSVTLIGQPRTATMRGQQARDHQPMGTRELEAVVSCTSDGLVMVLRKARPPIPSLFPPVFSPDFENGLFAAPWSEPLVRHSYHPESLYAVQPPSLPRYTPVRGPVKAAGGPSSEHLMKSIRDVAVFAWGLTGINGKIASYGRGKPSGESQPPDGLPIWDPDSPKTSYLGPEPPSSRHRGNMSSKVHATKSASPMPPSHMPSPAVGGGHGLAQILGQFDTISPGHLNSPFPPCPSAVTHSPELRASPRVQQQYHGPMAGHRGSTPRARWVGAAWAETSASYSRREAITTQISTTQDHSFGGSFRDPPRMQS